MQEGRETRRTRARLAHGAELAFLFLVQEGRETQAAPELGRRVEQSWPKASFSISCARGQGAGEAADAKEEEEEKEEEEGHGTKYIRKLK